MYPFEGKNTRFRQDDAEELISLSHEYKNKDIKPIILYPQSSIDLIKYSQDGKKMVTSSNTKSIKIWNVEDAKLLGEIAVLQERSVSKVDIQFSSDGKFLALRMQGEIVVWSISSQGVQKVASEKDVRFSKFSFISDSQRIALWQLPDQKDSLPQTVDQLIVWNFKNGDKKTIQQFQQTEARLFQGWTQDGRFWIMADFNSGMIRLYPLNGDHPLEFKTPPTLSGKFPDLSEKSLRIGAISPNNQIIAITDWNGGEVNIVNTKGDRLSTLRVPRAPKQQASLGGYIQFSSDGKRIFSFTQSKLKIWTVYGELIEERDYVGSKSAINPDGNTMVMATESGEVALYPIENLNDLLARGCEHLKIYLNSHPEARKRLPICQDPAIQNHRYNPPSPSPSAQSKINNYNSSLIARNPRKLTFQAGSITTTAVR
jgi:WD40 repeat protein